ncbi:MAG: PilZ domain-containing protein [Lautropia mirabilis]|nr:PilZ domain-containing protein [Lautropia mirabilis]MBF1257646.1 PilZ domain-containing protein [Lautropia mirabilis]MBF1263251.1 PilZ domain-containing protein [Lautropia mirabilis]RKW46833.1 MAG: pilus assembly protein PilZ [Lautropia sp.]DAS10053.1 MAG TPA: Tfp pilus assembly protein PilZ [Inoviridae sp.]
MAGNKPATRPGVIPLSIKEKSALLAAYMPFLENGGLFVPTDKSAQLGDELYIILTLMDDATKTAIPGRVAWVTPAGATNRRQGIGIQFSKTDASVVAREKIETLLGPALKSPPSSYTI